MTQCVWGGDERLRTAPTPGARWFDHVQIWRPRDPDMLVTGAAETAVVLLSGTFDLIGGATAWPARGARTTEFHGRPMAVFLPPRTEFRTQRGRGEILLVAARQPTAGPAPQGRELLGSKPLLALAGSGKAFDPNSGEWKPAETFPTAPESLPPRRMERLAVGAVTVERVLAADYKAATLSVDEVVLPAGSAIALRDIPGRPACDEVLVFVRTAATANLVYAGRSTSVHGDAALHFAATAGNLDATITAAAGPAYVVLAYAGKSGVSGS